MTRLRIHPDLRWWVAGLAIATVFYLAAARPWHLRWGATDEEMRETLPGDALVPRADLSTTRAITIQAPAAEVWPWLVQMGQDRGGFYSYQLLQNLIGSHVHNADRIEPQWQNLRAGDRIRIHPKIPALPVAFVEPGEALVLGGPAGMHPVRFSSGYFAASWAFVLRAVDARTSRLIVRLQADWSPTLLYLVVFRGILEPAHFVMERAMLLGIKQRAEQARH